MVDSYSSKYKDMMDAAYSGLDKKKIESFAKQFGTDEKKSRAAALQRSISDLKEYDKAMKEQSDLWARAENRPRQSPRAYEGEHPITMSPNRGLASLKAKVEALNNNTKDANPKNDGTISADVIYSEEIPMKMISNHVGNSAVEYIRSSIERNPTIAIRKKVVRVFARVKHYNFTPDPLVSPHEADASELDHTRTSMLTQFYGLMNAGASPPTPNTSIEVVFPDDKDTSTGLIVSAGETSTRRKAKKTSAQKAHEKNRASMLKEILRLGGME